MVKKTVEQSRFQKDWKQDWFRASFLDCSWWPYFCEIDSHGFFLKLYEFISNCPIEVEKVSGDNQLLTSFVGCSFKRSHFDDGI